MALYAEHETLIRNLAKKIHTHHNKAEILVEMVTQVAKRKWSSGDFRMDAACCADLRHLISVQTPPAN